MCEDRSQIAPDKMIRKTPIPPPDKMIRKTPIPPPQIYKYLAKLEYVIHLLYSYTPECVYNDKFIDYLNE